MKTTTIIPAFFTVTEVAALASVSTRVIYRLHDGGHMPAMVKVGGSTRFRRSEIEKWISDGCPKNCRGTRPSATSR